MNAFKNTIGTTLKQSKHLLEMGLSPVTADGTLRKLSNDTYVFEALPFCDFVDGIAEDALGNSYIPAWSLARLVAIAFDQNGPDSVIHLYRHSDPFADVIGFLDYQIERGLIKAEYLKQ